METVLYILRLLFHFVWRTETGLPIHGSVLMCNQAMTGGFDHIIERRRTNSLKWTRYGPEVLPLWVADMDFAAPEPVREALKAAVDHGVFGYEMPSRRLKLAVAERMLRLYGWQISPEMVVATPGVVAGFNTAARAVCNPSAGVLMQTPVYHPFFDVAGDCGAPEWRAPLRTASGPDQILRYEIDWERFEEGFSGRTLPPPKMFLLCHPHNPTGQVYSRADLERMAGICLARGTVICADEIHSELLLGGARHTPMASLSSEVAKATITLVSPSKTFNLVGLFCGFAIIPDTDLRARFTRALTQVALHVNSLGLIAAEVAMAGACDDWLTGLRRYLTENRDFLLEFLARELPSIRVTRPEATYLAWLDFSELIKQERFADTPHRFLLRNARVALNPGEDFGPGGENCARLNFGCPRATLAAALDRIKTAVAG